MGDVRVTVVRFELRGQTPAANREHVAAAEHRREQEREKTGTDDCGKRPLRHERFGAQVLGPVDSEEHDDEEEQHDDRAGVHDHLHRGEEVRFLRDEKHRDTEEGEHERERRVHRIAPHDDTDGPDEAHRGRADEDEEFHAVTS